MIHTRNHILASLNKIKVFVIILIIHSEINLNSRLFMVESIFGDLDEIVLKIKYHVISTKNNGEMLNKCEAIRKYFEAHFYNLKASSISIVDSISEIQQKQQNRMTNISQLKLNGFCENWMEFPDINNLRIHESQSSSDIQQNHHRLSAPSEEAARVIQALQTRRTNYGTTWYQIKQRCEMFKAIEIHQSKSISSSSLGKPQSGTSQSKPQSGSSSSYMSTPISQVLNNYRATINKKTFLSTAIIHVISASSGDIHPHTAELIFFTESMIQLLRIQLEEVYCCIQATGQLLKYNCCLWKICVQKQLLQKSMFSISHSSIQLNNHDVILQMSSYLNINSTQQRKLRNYKKLIQSRSLLNTSVQCWPECSRSTRTKC